MQIYSTKRKKQIFFVRFFNKNLLIQFINIDFGFKKSILSHKNQIN